MFLFFKFTIAITLVTFFLIKISRYKFFNFIYDKPDNKRKFHLNPTPLIGGIIIFISVVYITYREAFRKKGTSKPIQVDRATIN